VLAAHLGEQLLDVDVDLAGRPDVADLTKLSGWKRYSTSPTSLIAIRSWRASLILKPADGAQTWRVWRQVKSRRWCT
jgi:hypothetical protein